VPKVGSFELWEHQSEAKELLRGCYREGKRRALLVAPTGAGKTTIFCDLIHSAEAKGKRTIVLAHRKELINQASERLNLYGVEHGVIMSNDSRKNSLLQTQVASIATLANRPYWDNWADFIVIDEAHRARASSYLQFLERSPKAKVLGVTATPYRADGGGLGDIFDCMVRTTTTKELINKGILARPRIFTPTLLNLSNVTRNRVDYSEGELDGIVNKTEILGNVVDSWVRIAEGRRTIVFAGSVKHSRNLAQRFNDAGYKFIHLDAESDKIDKGYRKDILGRLQRHEIDGITNCALFVEGMDIPEISCVVLAGPTLSKNKYVQEAGRGLRKAEGKLDCVIIDNANLMAEHGSFLDEGDFTLEKGLKKKSKKEKAAKTFVSCSNCYASNEVNALVCAECGSPLASTRSAIVVEKAAHLQEIDLSLAESEPIKKVSGVREEIKKAKTRAQLEELAALKGYKAGWVKHIMESRQRKGMR